MSSRKPIGEVTGPSDAILPIQANPYMEQIVTGAKTIKYICEISPPRTRNHGDEPLEEDGIGNKEFNSRHKDWIGYDYAYKINSVYEVRNPISLKEMISTYGLRSAPRGIVFVPESIKEVVVWDQQIKLR
ncbi:MAG: hypothetical protein M1839_004266 [Geoglossum umbratile]|nr:MAG: hypothetical protein M1839_004266 [Geoglossum umbratile]